MKTKAEKDNENHVVSLEYLNKHNRNCPGCNKTFSVSNGKIIDIGSFGFIELYNKKNILYMYGICANCTNTCSIGVNTEKVEKNIELNLASKLGIKL